jgi:hypothetical protein
MARDDQRERIAAERRADVARQRAIAETGCDLAVGNSRASANSTRDLVDLPLERLDAIEVERNGREIARLTPQQRDDISRASVQRLSSRVRVASSLRSGNCTAHTPRALQAMPQRPIAVSNSVKPGSFMTRGF